MDVPEGGLGGGGEKKRGREGKGEENEEGREGGESGNSLVVTNRMQPHSKKALDQVRPLPLLFQSHSDDGVTNTLFTLLAPLSFLYPATHLLRAPLPHCPPPPSFPLSHFISLHLRLQFPLAPALNRPVCLLDGLHLPLAAFNLLYTGMRSDNLAGEFSFFF